MQNLERRKTSNYWYFYKKNRDFLCFLLHFFVTLLIFLLLFFFFWGIVVLYSSGWPGIHYMVRLVLNLWQSPCLSSVEILGLSWEYGFRVEHLPIACSRIWVSYPALFFFFNKQTNNITDPDWQLTSGILTHQLRICKGYEIWKYFIERLSPELVLEMENYKLQLELID